MRRWIKPFAIFIAIVLAAPTVSAEKGRFWRLWRLFRLRGKMSEVNRNPSDLAFGRENGLSSTLKPTWPGEHRHDARLRDQANDPAGGNVHFARSVAQDRRDLANNLLKRQLATVNQKERQEQLKKQLESQRNKEQQAREQRHKEQNRNIFQRFRAAWKARWQNRTVKADHQSPFETNGGFGENTQRAVLPINSKYVFRTDLNKRIPRPKPFRPPPRPPATPTF
jgi:hypothetical protein